MDKAQRERRHQANLARIDAVQKLQPGHRTRVDQEGTLLERARLLEEELCSHRATEAGLAALDRLLRRLEDGRLGHAQEVVALLAAVRDHRPLPLATLRGLPLPVGDDMLAVIDAYRHARLPLVEQVEGGPQRVARVLRAVAASAPA